MTTTAPAYTTYEAPPVAPRPARVGVAAPKTTLAILVVLLVLNARQLIAHPAMMLVAVLIGIALAVTVAIHEFAHFIVGSALGLDLVVRVGLLFGWCAPADGDESFTDRLTPGGHAAFAAAGPISNLLTWLALYFALQTHAMVSALAGTVGWPLAEMVRDFSLIFGILNLMPVGFLDGGRIAQAGIAALPNRFRRPGLNAFRVFSLTTCAVIGIHVVTSASWAMAFPTAYNLLLVGWLAVGSWIAAEDDEVPVRPVRRRETVPMAWVGCMIVLAFGLGAIVGQLAGATWFSA